MKFAQKPMQVFHRLATKPKSIQVERRSLIYWLASEIQNMSAVKCFILRLACTCEEPCQSVWPPNASLYATSTCRYLRLLASPFGQGLKETKVPSFLYFSSFSSDTDNFHSWFEIDNKPLTYFQLNADEPISFQGQYNIAILILPFHYMFIFWYFLINKANNDRCFYSCRCL